LDILFVNNDRAALVLWKRAAEYPGNVRLLLI